MEKTCCACKVCLPASLFSSDKRASDGLQSRCKPCAAAARRSSYASNPDAARQRQRDYYKQNPDVIKAINARSREKNIDAVKACKRAYYERRKHDADFIEKRDARTARIRTEKKAYDRLYRTVNAERLRQIKATWREKNKDLLKAVSLSYKARRRAVEKAGDSSRAIKEWIGRQTLTCKWCGANCAGNFHVDHIKPLARGGTHTTGNLCIACPPCNIRKNARDPEEFAASMSAATLG